MQVPAAARLVLVIGPQHAAVRVAHNEVVAAAIAAIPPAALDALGAGGRWSVGGHEVELTNLDKLLFPDAGFTKRDLVRYYTTIAPVILPYLRERKQFGRSIGEFQLIQGKIADMYTILSASRAYLYAVARSCDQGRTSRKDAAGVILFVSERATQMALETIQILGGNGYINDYAAGRLLRDAKLYEIGAGTSEVRRMLIGRELFKETA